MSNRGRMTLKIAGYISIISAIALLMLGIFVAFNTFDISDYYVGILHKIIPGMNNTDVNFYRISAIVNLVLSILINLYCGFTYLRIARVPKPALPEYALMLNSSLIQLFFGGTLIGAIMVLVVSIRNRHLKNAVTPTAKDSMAELSERVRALNALRNAGQIDEAEYTKQLNSLLENHVKK